MLCAYASCFTVVTPVTAPAIQIENAAKHYGDLRALDGVSLTIERSEFFGLLGPNGAGKTTTMKILTGFMAPTSGTARVAGLDVVTDSLEVRRKIGYLPESAPTYAEMQVRDYLDFIGQVRGLAAGHQWGLVGGGVGGGVGRCARLGAREPHRPTRRRHVGA